MPVIILKKNKSYKQKYIGINFNNKLSNIEIATGPHLDVDVAEEFSVALKQKNDKIKGRIFHDDERYTFKNSKNMTKVIIPSELFFKKKETVILIKKDKRIYIELKNNQ